MQAIVDGVLVAESPDEDVIKVEGNAYFPPSSLTQHVFSDSATPTSAPGREWPVTTTSALRPVGTAMPHGAIPRHDRRPSTS
jgi:hypothetical protein